MEILDSVLESIDDGEWHDINELSTTERLRKVSMGKLVMSLEFLREYEFVELGEVWKGDPKVLIMTVRLVGDVQAFISRIKKIERTERNQKNTESSNPNSFFLG